MICCGEERNTPFCAACGKKLRQGTLSDLLAYLRKQEGAARTWRRTIEDLLAGAEDEGRRGQFQKRVMAATGRVEKWESWRAGLERLLKEGS